MTPSLLHAALMYARLGWRVFPIDDSSKRPLTDNGFYDATTNPKTIAAWWRQYPNARIAVWLRGSGLVAIDVDHYKPGVTEAFRKLENTYGFLPRKLHQRSGNDGEHFIMADPSPGEEGWTRNADDGGELRGNLGHGIDVKCNGYILLAPSAGGKYRWDPEPDDLVAPPVPPSWLVALRKTEAELSATGPGIEAWRASCGPVDADRLRAKLSRLPKRGEGKGPTYHAVASVFHDCGLSVDEGWPFLLEWNEDCGKPHRGSELSRQVRRVAERDLSGRGERGWLLDAWLIEDAFSSPTRIEVPDPVDLTSPVSEVRYDVDTAALVEHNADVFDLAMLDSSDEEAVESRTDGGLFGVPVRDFLGDDDPGDDEEAWLIPGLIPAEAPSAIAGPPKSGKSFAMYLLAIAIAAGAKIFDVQAKQGPVLIICREDTGKGGREIKRRLWRVARGMGIDPRSLPIYVEAVKPIYLDDPKHVKALCEALARIKPVAVFIDNLSRVHLSDENDRSKMALVTNVWADICMKYTTAMVMLHHFVKSTETGGGPGRRMRGSGDLFALVRAVIGFERDQKDRSVAHVDVEGNLPSMSPPFSLTFTDDKNENGKPVIRIEHELRDPKPSADDEKTLAVTARTKVIEAFTDQPRHKSANAVAVYCRPTQRQVILTTVRAMLAEGVLGKTTDGELFLKRLPATPDVPIGSTGA